jgi:hypothetical protein
VLSGGGTAGDFEVGLVRGLMERDEVSVSTTDALPVTVALSAAYGVFVDRDAVPAGSSSATSSTSMAATVTSSPADVAARDRDTERDLCAPSHSRAYRVSYHHRMSVTLHDITGRPAPPGASATRPLPTVTASCIYPARSARMRAGRSSLVFRHRPLRRCTASPWRSTRPERGSRILRGYALRCWLGLVDAPRADPRA